jgi:hypothetical protein
MFRMGGLKAQHMLAKFGFVQPFRHEPAQASLALGCMIMGIAVQRVTGKGRSALTGDHENETVAPGACRLEKIREPQPRIARASSVQVELRIILNLAAQEALRRAAIETGEKRRLGGRDGTLRRQDCLRWRQGLR